MDDKIVLELKLNRKNKFLYSVSCNDYRVGGVKWNDVENGEYHKVDINVEDLLYTTKLLTSNQNQKAIECLKEVKEVAEKKLSELEDYKAKIYMGLFLYNIEGFIDNKIKELEETK